MALGAIEKRPETIDFHKTKASKNRLETNRKIKKVEWQQTQTIDVEHCTVHVVLTKFDTVRLKNTFLEITCAKVDRNVENIYKISEII